MSRASKPTALNECTGAQLGTQAHTRLGAIDPNLFKPVQPNVFPRTKPRDGGFWTSTWNESLGSNWIQWCMENEFIVPRSGSWDIWLLEPGPNARVLVIDGLEDLIKLQERWPDPLPPLPYGGFEEKHVGWHLLSEDFDAVHLSERGEYETRYTKPLCLYGWDCESTLWLRWAFAEIHHIGAREFILGAED